MNQAQKMQNDCTVSLWNIPNGMCCHCRQYVSTELQSLTGFHVMPVYSVLFDIMTEENVCDKTLRNDFAVGNTAR
jgi:transcription elongation factor Elf1